MQNHHLNRIKNLQQQIKENQIFLVSKPADIFYFSNFEFLLPEEREAFLLVSKNAVALIHASFSNLEKHPDFLYFEGTSPHRLKHAVGDLLEKEKNLTEIVIDPTTLFVNELDEILQSEVLQKREIKVEKDHQNIINELRKIKDEHEIALIKKASQITAKVMSDAISQLKIGQTEKAVTKFIKDQLESLGSLHLAFPTIVAFGENTARPHHQATNKALELNMPVLIDMGAKIDGYCSDMTRTVWFGETENINPEFAKVEQIVKNAYEQGCKQILQQPLQADSIDKAVRSYIQDSGFGEYFVHTTGHGVGIEIHEQPSLNWKNEMKLKEKMIITIEPGIYLAGKFGYRHENTILVENSNYIVLTQ